MFSIVGYTSFLSSVSHPVLPLCQLVSHNNFCIRQIVMVMFDLGFGLVSWVVFFVACAIHLVTTIYRAYHVRETDQGIKNLHGTQTIVESLDAKANVVEIHTNPVHVHTEDPVATRARVITDHRNSYSEWWGSALTPHQKVTPANTNPKLNNKSSRSKNPSRRGVVRM